jgi:hypothetical protein
LKPLKLFVVRKYGALYGSEAMNAEVTPTMATAGSQCWALARCPGKSQISF